VRALADLVRAHPGKIYAHIEAAFQELADPSIPAGLTASAALPAAIPAVAA